MLANGGWDLTLILLTWTIWRPPTNASKWRMGFNSAFKGLKWGWIRNLVLVCAVETVHVNERGPKFVGRQSDTCCVNCCWNMWLLWWITQICVRSKVTRWVCVNRRIDKNKNLGLRAMKAYGSGDITPPRFLDFGTRWWVSVLMPRPLYPGGQDGPVPVEYGVGCAPEPIWTLWRKNQTAIPPLPDRIIIWMKDLPRQL